MDTPPVRNDEAVLRPARLARVVGWCTVAFGMVFGASGFAQPDDTETLLTMLFAGLAFSVVGVTTATAAAHVSAAGIRYRNGLQRRVIPAASVLGVSVGQGSGTPPPRLAYIVQRTNGRSVRLIGVQRWRE